MQTGKLGPSVFYLGDLDRCVGQPEAHFRRMTVTYNSHMAAAHTLTNGFPSMTEKHFFVDNLHDGEEVDIDINDV